MKRVVATCDRCGEEIQHGSMLEIHCLHVGTGQDTRFEICPDCFSNFLFGFMGIKLKGVNENVQGERESDAEVSAAGNEAGDRESAVAGQECGQGDQSSAESDGEQSGELEGNGDCAAQEGPQQNPQ